MIGPMIRVIFIVLTTALPAIAQRPPPFRIAVVDDVTGRGVPLVELETVHAVRFVTDSNGLCAIDEPELLGRRVFFHVRSHGYELPADGFGYRGFACEVVRGGSHEVRLPRVNVAERLYRVTGAGIYRDTVLLGEDPPIAQPLMAGGVFGCDSVVNAIYRGRLWWFWGDTNRAAYPLGNFEVTGATSALPQDGGLPPGVGVDLDVFVGDGGFARAMSPIDGPGPVWIFGLMVVDDGGGERMLAHYARMKDLGTRYEHGIVEWDDEAERFVKCVEFPLATRLHPTGNPVRVVDADGDWFVFPSPYPVVRVAAQRDAIVEPDAYQGFVFDTTTEEWDWRAGAQPLTPDQALEQPAAQWMTLRDIETGEPIRAHGGTVFWNAHRGRWIAIVLELFGRSTLGEVWFAEADTPLGPWGFARRIVTHDEYSFYNVKQHPYFDEDGGRVVYFEGTYTATFSGNDQRTPRYDYNQVMYRLDLDDPRLELPVPVYRVRAAGEHEWLVRADIIARDAWSAVEGVAFHALPASGPGRGFRPLPPGSDVPCTVPLFRWSRDEESYLAPAAQSPPGVGWRRSDEPEGLVWPAPARMPPLWPTARPTGD